MKTKLSNIEILNKLSDLYFEVLINDEEELNNFLIEEKFNLNDLDLETEHLIRKLERDAKIHVNKKLKSNQNIYERAKLYVNSLPSIDAFIKSLSKEEIDTFELAYRNAKIEGKNDLELKKEIIILKIMEDLNDSNE